jgi:thioredoxin-like negative regulator of GroEL
MQNTSGLSLVFFSSENCASCHYWEQLLWKFKSAHNYVNVFRVDAARDQALVEEFEIFHLPAIYLYMDGEFHSEIQCVAKLEVLEKEIQKLMLMPAQELP